MGVVLTESEPAPMAAPTVLIVDDDRTNRMVLRAILHKEGYAGVDAENGEQAVELFAQVEPDLVLMDVMMPVMDGYEATRRIKEQSGERLTPVIFLTALTDEKALAQCIEAGGDDFLTKPYNRVILRAKMDAMLRLRQMNQALAEHREQLGRHNDRLEREQAIAESVFAKVRQPESLEGLGIRHTLVPVGKANGDVVMAERRPDGGCNYLLGDFTGHGLAAAVGAVPTSDLFRAMSREGASIDVIAEALNERLRAVLPTGLFLAACLVGREPDGAVQVWNGGVPDALFFQPDGQLHRIVSSHLPLGVVGDAAFDGSLEVVHPPPGTRLYLYSDGVIEARNESGEHFGEARLEAALQAVAHDHRFGSLAVSLARFRKGALQEDDITLVEIDCSPSGEADLEAELWSLEMRLAGRSVGESEPIEALVDAIGEHLQSPGPLESIRTILGELYNNAVDYGLLGLDGSEKRSAEGFGRFFEARGHLLGALRHGRVTIRVRATLGSDGRRRLHLRVEDSGSGFDYQQLPPELEENYDLSGRGIRLSRSLCESLTFSGRGNVVEAVYIVDEA